MVDGALVNRSPAISRKMGADLVIALMWVGHLCAQIRHLPDVIIQTIDILSRQAAYWQRIDCDVLIEPDLGNVTLTQLNRAEEIIEKGREAAWKALPEIKSRLAGWV